MSGARCTRGLVCKIVRRDAHEHTGSAETLRHSPRNGFTAYAVLSPATNSSCHRRQRIDGSPRPGWAGVPPRTWRQQRASGPHGFAVRDTSSPRGFAGPGTPPAKILAKAKNSAVRPARRCSLTENRPANKPARRRCRVHHIPSRVRDDRDPPLLGDETARTGDLICLTKPAKCFCGRDWTTQISLKFQRKLKFTRSGFFGPSSSSHAVSGLICSVGQINSEAMVGTVPMRLCPPCDLRSQCRCVSPSASHRHRSARAKLALP
jgi:hypothetical protein